MDTNHTFMCKKHKKEIIFVCSCDHKYLCSSCFDSGQHSIHEVDIYAPPPQNEENNKKSKMSPSNNKMNYAKDDDDDDDVVKINSDKSIMKEGYQQYNEVEGDLLTFNADIIVQQCNCITTNAKGLSQAIQKKFGVSAYDRRIKGQGNIANLQSIDIPGTCTFVKPRIKRLNCKIQYIANFFSQFAPGKTSSKYQSSVCDKFQDPMTNQPVKDFPQNREKWFQQCLQNLSEFANEKKLRKIAFPYNIGCGLAGGKWDNYKQYIKDFSNKNKNLIVFIVKLRDDE